MTDLHILEYPNEVTLDQIQAAFEALGFPMRRCKSLTLTAEGFEAEMWVEDLIGGIRPQTVTVRSVVRPGRSQAPSGKSKLPRSHAAT